MGLCSLIADGRGLVAALDLGAQAVSLGTRFLCSEELKAAREYKERVVAATAEDTLYTKMFDVGWPDASHRVLRNTGVREWEAAGSLPVGERFGEGDVVGKMPVAGQTIDLPRYGVFMPLEGFEGDLEHAVLYCGQSCALVNDIKPAARIVQDLVQAADRLLGAARRKTPRATGSATAMRRASASTGLRHHSSSPAVGSGVVVSRT
jgi:NAD(P)H-dependent flavin oxidoreductase YrpB (nitropropane dioxygenase family)